jgi:hypothetical protein
MISILILLPVNLSTGLMPKSPVVCARKPFTLGINTIMSNKSEAVIQQAIRLEASKRGIRLWRNNTGAITTDEGRHVRFGLGNESASLNKSIKFPDLVGITPLYFNGNTYGIFTGIEVKREGWVYSATPREVAQQAGIQLINSLGGIAYFSTGEIL